MTQRALRYYKQEVAMCKTRIRVAEGRNYPVFETGNPMTREEARQHLARTRAWIAVNRDMFS